MYKGLLCASNWTKKFTLEGKTLNKNMAKIHWIPVMFWELYEAHHTDYFTQSSQWPYEIIISILGRND